jgi:hypothetical protein
LFPTGALNAERAALALPATFGKDGDFDFNGDNAILFPTDARNAVSAALNLASCTP